MKATTVKEVFDSLPSKLDKDAAEDLDAVYQFDLRGSQGGQYHLLVQNGTCVVKDGTHADPHVILSMTGEDCFGYVDACCRRDQIPARRHRCSGLDSAEAVQSTPVGDNVRYGLAAAHLRGPRSIVHLLDHLLSPVGNVVPDPARGS